MISRPTYAFALVLVLALGLGAGCDSTPAAGTPGAEATPIEQVGQLLRTCQEQNKPGPKTIKEAEKIGAGFPKGLEALRSGEVVIYWGVNLDEYGGASAVGYERKTPEQGGMVILGDGSVIEMTAEQFKDVPRPPESKLKQGGGGKSSR